LLERFPIYAVELAESNENAERAQDLIVFLVRLGLRCLLPRKIGDLLL